MSDMTRDALDALHRDRVAQYARLARIIAASPISDLGLVPLIAWRDAVRRELYALELAEGNR